MYARRRSESVRPLRTSYAHAELLAALQRELPHEIDLPPEAVCWTEEQLRAMIKNTPTSGAHNPPPTTHHPQPVASSSPPTQLCIRTTPPRHHLTAARETAEAKRLPQPQALPKVRTSHGRVGGWMDGWMDS